MCCKKNTRRNLARSECFEKPFGSGVRLGWHDTITKTAQLAYVGLK